MADLPKQPRLDEHLVAEGLFPSRSRARDAVERGTVVINGQIAAKPSMKVAPDAQISVSDPASGYVSRAALKLKAGLEQSGYHASGLHALDVGASTGGFTQVLLEAGAAHVTAIDVGHDQMHESLRADRRVTVIEGLNARDLTAAQLADAPQFIVCDVSFISLMLAMPPALSLAAPGARAILLVKPQFEVGRALVGKNGIVARADADAASTRLRDWLAGEPDWTVEGLVPSPVTGGDGNSEFLLWGRKHG